MGPKSSAPPASCAAKSTCNHTGRPAPTRPTSCRARGTIRTSPGGDPHQLAYLYRSTLSGNGTTETIVPDYAVLDAELDNAARRGKQIFLILPAGEGIPPWIFNDYVPSCAGEGCVPASTIVATETGIAPKSVVPITTSDFGTGDTSMPTDRSCGYMKKMGSPADPAYTSAMLTMISKVAEHIRASTLRYQALGSFEITGLNFLTGETRLPNRCLDPTVINAERSVASNLLLQYAHLGRAARRPIPAYEALPNRACRRHW